MQSYTSEITSVSSRGQVVLPVSIRNEMNLQPGAKLMVISDGESILLKPIVLPDVAQMQLMLAETQTWAEEVGLTEDDINDAIKTVRARKKAEK